MKIYQNPSSAQGDLRFTRVDSIPAGWVRKDPVDREGVLVHIVAHSETGHHHTFDAVKDNIEVEYYTNADDFMKAFIVVKGLIQRLQDGAVSEHHRSLDQHEPILFPPGIYELQRQREYTPAGWVRIND